MALNHSNLAYHLVEHQYDIWCYQYQKTNGEYLRHIVIQNQYHKLIRKPNLAEHNYNKYLYQPFLRLANRVSYIDWDLYDKYFINGFGHVTKWLSFFTGRTDYDGLDQTNVDGLGRSMGKFGSSLKEIQTGRLQNFMLFALFGVIIIIIFQSF